MAACSKSAAAAARRAVARKERTSSQRMPGVLQLRLVDFPLLLSSSLGHQLAQRLFEAAIFAAWDLEQGVRIQIWMEHKGIAVGVAAARAFSLFSRRHGHLR